MMSKAFEIVYLLSILLRMESAYSEITQSPVSTKANRSPIKLTWKSTGSCPPLPRDKVCEWLASPSFVQNLAWISAVPNSGIEFVRIHWLLSAVFADKIEDSHVLYNFTCLDWFFRRLHRFNLTPIFEIMGNPSNLFEDFENMTQVLLWRDLMFEMASRYIDMFGLNYVKRWIFETWNEPKMENFESIKMTPQGFLNYYDATVEGLKRAQPLMKLATPGGGCSRRYDTQNYCWFLLHHIQFGNSAFESRGAIFPDFVSIHKKGVFPNSSSLIVKGEEAFIWELDRRLPSFRGVGIMNDEADPQVSWNLSRKWQADTSYAVLMVKAIEDHVCSDSSLLEQVSFLSNDNAFLSYHPFPFTQRTILARFQVNTTEPPHVRFVRKPSYLVLGLLSLLGEEIVGDCTSEESFGRIVTVHDEGNADSCWYLSIIVTRFDLESKLHANLTTRLEHLPMDVHPGMKYVLHYMDNEASNPYAVWLESGSPQTPSREVFLKMRQHEEPILKWTPSNWTQGSSGTIAVEMAPVSVGLFQLCSTSCGGPGQVVDLQGMNVTYNLLFVFWSDSKVKTKCLYTYEVEHSKDGVDFRKINPKPTIFNSFVFEGGELPGSPEETVGYYRVRAVDFWGNFGKYSDVFKYPDTSWF